MSLLAWTADSECRVVVDLSEDSHEFLDDAAGLFSVCLYII